MAHLPNVGGARRPVFFVSRRNPAGVNPEMKLSAKDGQEKPVAANVTGVNP